jgi:acid phosphatase (class A)
VGRSIGSWFNPDDLPVTVDVLGRVWRDASYYMWRLKFKYARFYNIDPKMPLQEPNWAAFPSGHSFYAHMLAYLYSELAPSFLTFSSTTRVPSLIPAKSSVFIFRATRRAVCLRDK